MVVGAGEGTDDALAQIGRLESKVAQEMLHVFDHRPLEQDLAGFVVASKAGFDLVAAQRAADPDIVGAPGPKCVAQAALHVGEGSPADQVRGRSFATSASHWVSSSQSWMLEPSSNGTNIPAVAGVQRNP